MLRLAMGSTFQKFAILAGLQAFATTCVLPALAGERTVVNIELLLSLDVSASVDKREYELELKGIALALRDPDVVAAVDTLRPLGVAIAVTQWGGPGESRVIIPFTHIENGRDAKAFGFLVGRSYRFIGATTTSIVTAIEEGVELLTSNDFDGQRLVIDISGDGKDNSGLSLDDARQRAQAAHVVINGLAIEADESGLAAYYRNSVITGADAFVEQANDFGDFARAIKAKLLRELRPLAT
jgi:hypothetical protein